MGDRTCTRRAVERYRDHFNEQVSRLVGVLEELGQLDNTIVIYTSDHGDMLAEHGLFTKSVPAYEGVHNVPLVIAGPGLVNRGRAVDGHPP